MIRRIVHIPASHPVLHAKAWHRRLGFLLSLLVAGLALPAEGNGQPSTPGREDLLFLNRIAYGANAATLREYRQLGRERYLASQLVFRADGGLPSGIRQRIAEMDISRLSPADLLDERRRAEQQFKSAPDSVSAGKIRKAINERNNELGMQAAERRILRDLYSQSQLQEQLLGFWFNHFTVFQYKGNIPQLLADYEEHAIRPHVLGKFRDLVLATLTHPAMLIYLDNAQNAAGAVNENYARELMERQTLGVHGGYTQSDVQALARILTGVGVDLSGKGCPGGQTRLTGAEAPAGGGLFCFNPKRHDSGEKLFLGQTFPPGGGLDEVLRAVNLLVRSPASAQFISRRLAVYFLSDDPPQALLNEMARTFQNTDGDIALTLKTLFHSPYFRDGKALGNKYKDPVQYVLSSLRLLYGGQPIQNIRPAVNWINQLGEPLYGHPTPDGYGMREKDWLSADQMTKRFEVAKAIYWNAGALYVDEPRSSQLEITDKKRLQDLRKEARESHPIDVFGIYDLLRPILSDTTLATLKKSLSFDEWNALLLSSPEWMYR
ncbi:MAG: DUF1800 domain-containing protein [Sulfuricellaceae bacterium]|nr:DUF1800 domain-containing protein [Sulfuricellaceae bacterium]